MQLEGPSIVLLVGGTKEATDELVEQVISRARSTGADSIEGSEDDHVMDELRDFPSRATVRLSGRSELPHAVVAASEDVEALVYPTIGTSFVYAPRWVPEDVAAIRREMAQAGGHVVVWHGSPALDAVSTWGEVGPELSLMRAVKTVFDPQRIMSPGRFVGDI
jgi:glycolate oxidase FAD binding subunit